MGAVETGLSSGYTVAQYGNVDDIELAVAEDGTLSVSALLVGA